MGHHGTMDTGHPGFWRRIDPARATSMVIGVLAGLGGFVHGVGEALQGNVAPAGVVIMSWTRGPIAEHLGGEPGMTLIPNMLVTGVACMGVSAALIVWSVGFARGRRGALVQLGLVIAMLLVGGGFAPPLLGVLGAVAGMGFDPFGPGRRRQLPVGLRRLMAGAWPWLFSLVAVSGTVLVVGSFVLVYTIGLHAPDFFVYTFFFTTVTLMLTIVVGVGRGRGRLGDDRGNDPPRGA